MAHIKNWLSTEWLPLLGTDLILPVEMNAVENRNIQKLDTYDF